MLKLPGNPIHLEIDLDADDTQSVSKRWRRHAAVAKVLSGVTPGDYSQEIASLHDYVQRKGAGPLPAVPDRHISNLGNMRLDRAVADGLSGDLEWARHLPEIVDCLAVSNRMLYFEHIRYRERFPGDDRPIRTMPWESCVEAAALCFVCGDQNAGRYQALLALAVLNCQYFPACTLNLEHRRGHAFMLRLMSAASQLGSSAPWPEWAYDVPVYEALIANWDGEDLAALEGLIVKACNRHTHQARSDQPHAFFDFGDPRLSHFPLEILLVFAMRRLRGLANPVIQHPVLLRAFSEVPYQAEVRCQDELIAATLKRYSADHPAFARRLGLPSVQLDAAQFPKRWE